MTIEDPSPTLRPVHTKAQADAISTEIEEHADGWVTAEFAPDWDDWLDRVEGDLGLDLGSDMNGPGIKRVLAIGRRVRRETV